MAIQQDDFTGGVVTDRPPYVLRATQSPLIRNAAIDDDGTLVALPWQLPRAEMATPTLTVNTDIWQVSPVSPWHVRAGVAETHVAPVNYRLSCVSAPAGQQRNTLYTYDNGLGLGEQQLSLGVAPLGILTPLGVGQFVQYFDDVGVPNGPAQYVCMWGNRTDGVRIFETHRLKLDSPPTTVIDSIIGTTSLLEYYGARFPAYATIYRGRLRVAGDVGSDIPLKQHAWASDFGASGLGTFNYQNAQIFGDGRDFAITGVKAFGDSLYFPNTSGVVRETGSNPQSSSIDYLMDGYGCIAPNSIQLYDGYMIYLSRAGFIAMSPSGSYEMLTDKNRARVKAMVNAQSFRTQDGVMNRLGGASVVHNDRYWYAWPNEGEVWCYDFRYKEWTFFDQRTMFARNTQSVDVPYVIALAASEGKYPIFQYRGISASNLFDGLSFPTKILSPTHKRSGGVTTGPESYASQYNVTSMSTLCNLATFVLPTIELQAPDSDRTFKRIVGLSLDVELDWTDDDTDTGDEAGQNVWCIELLNESNDSIARAYFQKKVHAQKIHRVYFRPADLKPSETIRARIFAGATDFNRDVQYGVTLNQAQVQAPVLFRLHAVRWIREGESEALMPDSTQDGLVPVEAGVAPNYNNERFVTEPLGDDTTGLARFPWALKAPQTTPAVTPGPWVYSPSGWNPISATSPSVVGLVQPMLDGYDQWEIQFAGTTPLLAPAGTQYVQLGLFHDWQNTLMTSAGTMQVSPFAPISADVRNEAGGAPQLFVRWYEGTDGAGRQVNISAASLGVAWTLLALRITRVPRTSTFYVDISVNGLTQFAVDRNQSNRIVAHLPSLGAQVPLNPWVAGRADGVSASSIRVIRVICRTLREAF
jgi:hypothetical protein